MRIVQINAVPGGSTGKLALALHEKALDNNEESIFIYTSGQTEKKGTIKIGSRIDQKIHALFSRLTGLQGYWSSWQTKKIIDFISHYAPDVVHLHNLHANSINIGLLLTFFAERNIAVCVTLHDCFFFTGHCCYYTDIECYRWQESCGNCPAMKKYNTSLFFDTSRKSLADKRKWFEAIDKLAIVGVSQWICNETKKSILKHASYVDYVYNWIDFGVFYPRTSTQKSEQASPFLILGVAESWSESKGIYDFIELSNRLEYDEMIMLVGACNIELPDRICLIDRTENQEKLAELYSQADVFVSFSRQETFGLVTAEALSCGTPVVVYNNTASPELVGEGCGYVCPDGDIDAVVKRIRQIKAGGKEQYSERCVDYAHKVFDPDKNIAKYLRVYGKICGGIENDSF